MITSNQLPVHPEKAMSIPAAYKSLQRCGANMQSDRHILSRKAEAFSVLLQRKSREDSEVRHVGLLRRV